MEKTLEIPITVCDVCGKQRQLFQCDVCGKMVCRYCAASVVYTQLENVRGHIIGFAYNRIMCQSHIMGIGMCQ